MASGEFAAMLCPGWMLGVISGNAPDITGWDIADAFPGGGGNWGGSYLTVPANGAHVKEAAELAAKVAFGVYADDASQTRQLIYRRLT